VWHPCEHAFFDHSFSRNSPIKKAPIELHNAALQATVLSFQLS
jgi:hypothetical protein